MGGGGQKEHKSSSEMGPLEMQDGLNVGALINIIAISLMMSHGTETVVMNPVVSPPHFQHAAFHWWGAERGLLPEFTPLSLC